MQTIIGLNDPQAVQRWSRGLAVDTENRSFFPKFTGKGPENIIEQKTDLEEGAGDTIKFDLLMSLRGDPTFGDDNIDGKGESLRYYQQSVSINQVRHQADGGGKLTRQRTLHDVRKHAKTNLAKFMAEYRDEYMFAGLSGSQGVNEDSKDLSGHLSTTPLLAPDAAHLVYAGAATSKASLVVGDTMSAKTIEKVSALPAMMNAVNPDVTEMMPVSVGGGRDQFVFIMSPWSAYDMRIETGDTGWAKYQAAAAAAEGRASPLFKGGLGMINNTILHEFKRVRRFSDYGAGANVKAARNLFLGQQAGTLAYGGEDGSRYSWFEETYNAGNNVAITAGCIMGFTKTRFNGYDFGVIAVDSAAKQPA